GAVICGCAPCAHRWGPRGRPRGAALGARSFGKGNRPRHLQEESVGLSIMCGPCDIAFGADRRGPGRRPWTPGGRGRPGRPSARRTPAVREAAAVEGLLGGGGGPD